MKKKQQTHRDGGLALSERIFLRSWRWDINKHVGDSMEVKANGPRVRTHFNAYKKVTLP